ncbi:MAG: hypothetical protein GWN55_06460 [Phycisphaerae bacterium]|nr:hypothetical protein [Phycisphaerae bacterium]
MTMKSLKPSQSIIKVFSPLFRIHAHHLIYLGYLDARPKMKSGDDETSITGYITEAIQNRLEAPDPPRWYKQYFVRDDPPIYTEGRTGRARLRLDINIEANWEGRPNYCFEAKRLRKKGFPVSKYVGSEGMECFVNGLYASRYPEAAMLGYIQSDSVEYWREEVMFEIDQKAEILHLKSPQQDVKIIEAFPIEWSSKHDRMNVGHPITIYHILLDCC